MPMDTLEYLQKALVAEGACTTPFTKADIILHSKLVKLWKNWEKILGEELALLCIPLGTQRQSILLGVEDSCAMQEMQYYKDEILNIINDFLEEPYFTHIILKQHLGEEILSSITHRSPLQKPPIHITSSYTSTLLPQDSPVAKAYLAFIKAKTSYKG